MKLKFVLVLIMIVGLSAHGEREPAKAQSQPSMEFTVYGFGAASCGSWTGPLSQNIRTIQEQWIMGYLTGVGYGRQQIALIETLAASGSTPRAKLFQDAGIATAPFSSILNMKDTDLPGATAWLDSYCRDHPLDNIGKAAGALVRALR